MNFRRKEKGKCDDNEQDKGCEQEAKEEVQKHSEFGSGHYTCKILGKDRNFFWKNFNMVTAKMGIKRELVKTLVKENEEIKIQMEDLTDLALVILSDITKEEPNMDVLKNANNSAIDSYRTTKWTFYEIQELKYRVGRLERDNNIIMNR